MKIIKSFWIVIAIPVTLLSCNRNNDEGKSIHIDHIVDLTHTLTPEFPFIPVKKLTYPF